MMNCRSVTISRDQFRSVPIRRRHRRTGHVAAALQRPECGALLVVARDVFADRARAHWRVGGRMRRRAGFRTHRRDGIAPIAAPLVEAAVRSTAVMRRGRRFRRASPCVVGPRAAALATAALIGHAHRRRTAHAAAHCAEVLAARTLRAEHGTAHAAEARITAAFASAVGAAIAMETAAAPRRGAHFGRARASAAVRAGGRESGMGVGQYDSGRQTGAQNPTSQFEQPCVHCDVSPARRSAWRRTIRAVARLSRNDAAVRIPVRNRDA
ncbi:hypothetical protein FAZ98_00800 [Paraburkholderia acidisoli]|uniref:Uncharacterized protein n=1 Tax=Paraburkholderia acidisoli TaxID=2571748 RepID=A0A7Z2GEL4_9BURK|nr:hypothetical protein FAZ98_00800 [Paraburkholderia acidisoli]